MRTNLRNSKGVLQGFTLIELLIVVAIVAIVGAVLFPIFARSRDTGHHPSCQDKLKRIGLGLMQYTQDYDERLPRQVNGFSTDAKANYLSWRRVLDPYTKNQHLFQCPSRPNTDPTPVSNPYDGFPQSYDVTDCGPIQAGRPIVLAQIKKPAITIMVFEENGDTPEAQQIGVPWDRDNGAPNWVNILYAGHLQTSNYLFADGHVKALKPLSTVASGGSLWHLNPNDPVTPRVWEKVRAAERNFG